MRIVWVTTVDRISNSTSIKEITKTYLTSQTTESFLDGKASDFMSTKGGMGSER